jgi:hypothetical protein
MVNEKIRNIERNHQAEKSQLIEIIQNNVMQNINKDLQLRDSKEVRRQVVKEKLKELKNRFNEESNSESSSEENKNIKEQKNLIEELNRNYNLKNIIRDNRRKNEKSNKNKPTMDTISVSSRSDYSRDSASPFVYKNRSIINPKINSNVKISDNEMVRNALLEIKNDIANKLNEESIRNQESFSKLATQFKQLKNEMTTHVEQINHKLKIDHENLRYILERSGIPRIKKLIQKVYDSKYKF